jgi:2,5-diketo-D-gluconate reductase A
MPSVPVHHPIPPNGPELPPLGFGVFQTPPEETIAAVPEATRVGYRLIDTAAAYGNEHEVGEGIRRSGVEREEAFIETKVWINDYGFEATLHAFDKSAGKLEVEQLDLLILHQPVPAESDPDAITLESQGREIPEPESGPPGVPLSDHPQSIS